MAVQKKSTRVTGAKVPNRQIAKTEKTQGIPKQEVAAEETKAEIAQEIPKPEVAAEEGKPIRQKPSRNRLETLIEHLHPKPTEPPEITWNWDEKNGILSLTAKGNGNVNLVANGRNLTKSNKVTVQIAGKPGETHTAKAVFLDNEANPITDWRYDTFVIPGDVILPPPTPNLSIMSWPETTHLQFQVKGAGKILIVVNDSIKYTGEYELYQDFWGEPGETYHIKACIVDDNGNALSEWDEQTHTIASTAVKPGQGNGGNGPGNGGGGTNDGDGNKLESMDFRNIISGPLKACVEAQQEAANATFNYMTSTMLEKDAKGHADFKPVMMHFYFTKEGLIQHLEMPLMSILPIPYININYVDLDFEAMITYCKKDTERGDVKLKACYPVTSRLLKQTGNTKGTHESQDKEVDTVNARENINIRIRATTSDLPAGLSRLIEILDTHMTEFSKIVNQDPIAPTLK